MSRFPRARPVAGQKRVRPLKTVETHVMINAGQTDHRGEPICDFCGLLAGHRIHDLNVSSEAEAIDRRIVGEGNDGS